MHLAPLLWVTHTSRAGIHTWDASSVASGGASKKRKYFIWTPLNPVNTRKCNSHIKVYISNLFLNSLISDNEQGLKSLVCLQRYSVPLACLLKPLMEASTDKRVCLQIWFCKKRSLVSTATTTDRHAPGSQLTFDQASALPRFQIPAPGTDNPVLEHSSTHPYIIKPWAQGAKKVIGSEHMVDAYHCRYIELHHSWWWNQMA